MSAGLNLIQAIASAGDRSAFRRISVDMFTQEELPFFHFMANHVNRYREIPSIEIFRENGFQFPLSGSGNVDYFMDRVRHRWLYNVIAEVLPRVGTAVSDRDFEKTRQLISELNRAASHQSQSGVLVNLTEEFQTIMEELTTHRGTHLGTGVTLGNDYIDRITGGVIDGEVCTIVGRPGQGKSWKMIWLALKAWEAGKKVLFCSMEMSSRQVAKRMLAITTRIPPNFIMRGAVSNPAIDVMGQRLGEADIEGRERFCLLEGGFTQSVDDISSAIHEFEPDVVYIDASYLVRPSRASRTNARWERLAEVGEEIKSLTLNVNRPFIQSVQFNREAARTKDPELHQIGGTDVVGQISAIALGLSKGPGESGSSEMLVKVMKNREGESEVAYVTNFLFEPFNMDFIRTHDLESDPQGDADGEGERPIDTKSMI